MATIKAFIRTQREKETKIRFRLSDGTRRQLFFTSHLMVLPSLWDANRECIKLRSNCTMSYRKNVDDGVFRLKEIIMQVYSSHYAEIGTSRELQRKVEQALCPTNGDSPKNIDEEIEDLVMHKNLSQGTIRGYNVLKNKLKEFEAFKRKYNPLFSLSLRRMDEDIIRQFFSFLQRLERSYSTNYQNSLFRKLRALFREMVSLGIITRCPTDNITIKAEKYGTPYYISIEERNIIANYDLSAYPNLEVQRDIFLFQCCIGCRVSDLTRLTYDNIINNAIEYVPKKTRESSADIVRVPLNNSARALVAKYKDVDRQGRLFPFVSDQRYNKAIKRIFTICGITRSVLVYDSTLGKEVRKPLNEIASSHLARRTFIGNLYKKVKDPNIVGSMSGHKDGSKAFSRYRNIDDDIKKELVDLLD